MAGQTATTATAKAPLGDQLLIAAIGDETVVRACRISCSVSEFLADGLLARAESYRYSLRDYLPPTAWDGRRPMAALEATKRPQQGIEQGPAWPPIAACVQ